MKVSTQTKKSRFNKRFYYLLISLLVSLSVFSQNVGINSTGAQPNASAGLDVDFSNKGLLIPRVALTSTTSFSPLSAHVAGMVVYNTATVSDVTPGFYYDNGTKWIPGFLKGLSIGDMLYWSGTEWLRIPIGVSGQYLQISGSNIPTWGGNVFATLSTTSASTITASSASSGGNIISDGGSAVLSRGVCWNTLGVPTIADSKSTDASGVGIFTSSISGLTSGTTYHVRAYAMNSNVIKYGNEITFITLASVPVINPTNSTVAITSITANSAVTGGNFATDGGSPITQRGVCYATTSAPTIANSKVIDASTGVGAFVSNLTGLAGGTLYYVRSYATNSVGTTYGTQLSFTTSVSTPTLVTVASSNITGISATSGASMSWNGGGYSNYQAYGIAYSTVSNSATPTFVATNSANGAVNIATPIAPWTTNLTGLTANTTYYIRSYLNLFRTSTSSWITVFGNELSFTTAGAAAPVIASTTAITNLSATTANSGGTITSDGGSPITAKGVCWGLTASPILGAANFTSNGTGSTAFISNLTGLTGNTTYHLRAYATNSIGTTYGPADVTFTTWVQAPYAIGENVGYGTVGYVAPDGSGFIVSPGISPTAPATNFSWGCSGTAITLGTAIGTGKANTDLIIASCGAGTAAGIAKAYNGGGFSDWYLPSSGEWGVLTPIYNLFGLNYNTSYFTSSGYGSNTYATSYFSTGSQAYASGSPRNGDSYTTAILAIRNFAPATMATVTTTAITNIGAGSATGGGEVTSDGGAPILASGVCWSTSANPTIANSKSIDASALGVFASNISGLSLATTYYVRAYVTNAAGTSYGTEVSFTTAATASSPIVTTDAIVPTTATDATCGGNVTSDGGNPVTAYGVCWSTTTLPTIADSKTTDGTGIGAFVSNITGLTTGTTYYVRAYATNGIGTTYGNEVVFGAGLPVVISDAANLISAGSVASTYSYVSNDLGLPITETGLCWSTSHAPTILGSHTIDPTAQLYFWSELNNLTVGTTYYIRAYAINEWGIGYSNEVSFVATAATVGQHITTSTGNDAVVISTDGTNGLMASGMDMGVSDWGCPSDLTGATGTTIGTGLSNTTSILSTINLNACASASLNSWYGLFAAQVPSSIMGTKWYLPSKAEVDVIYSSLGTTSLPVTGLQLWSSSEVDATNAWYFNGTIWKSGLKSDDTLTIWPIRSF